MLRVYRLNTGSCGGCDLEIDALIDSDDTISWANTPFEADALLLTGPIPAAIRPALLALLHAVGETLPLIAVGRCAIDGSPFGAGGVAALPRLHVAARIEGCPVTPAAIRAVIHQAVTAGNTEEAAA